jgi:alpha-L-fucosidase
MSKDQLREEFLSWNFGMFIHFNMATYHEVEWANGHEDPSTFSPVKLDCDQWIEAADAAGMKYAVLTVKHTGGWCLWDSEHTTTHDTTAFINYKNGKGDIVKEFVEACRKRGIKVGLYYCVPGDYAKNTDWSHPIPAGKDNLYGMPPEARGDFAGFIKKQFTELLTEYGPIDLLWIDQWARPQTREHWQDIMSHVKSLQPDCLVIANNSLNFKTTDIHSFEYPYHILYNPEKALPPEANTHAAEVSDILGPAWFWKERENESNLKSAADIVKVLKVCNSRRANYLLNVAPDRSGLIPAHSVKRLKEVTSN